MKQTLVISVAMIFLCVVMLAGTTLAWFVESEESAKNTIYSGNLNADILYKTDLSDDWHTLTSNSSLFTGEWIPGTTKTLYIMVENSGDTAFNFALSLDKLSETQSVNLANEELWLSNYIDAGVVFGNTDSVLDSEPQKYVNITEFTSTAVKNIITDGSNEYKPVLRSGDTYYGKIVLNMPSDIKENATNYAQGSKVKVPALQLGLTAVATQIEDMHNDDFGDVGVSDTVEQE